MIMTDWVAIGAVATIFFTIVSIVILGFSIYQNKLSIKQNNETLELMRLNNRPNIKEINPYITRKNNTILISLINIGGKNAKLHDYKVTFKLNDIEYNMQNRNPIIMAPGTKLDYILSNGSFNTTNGMAITNVPLDNEEYNKAIMIERNKIINKIENIDSVIINYNILFENLNDSNRYCGNTAYTFELKNIKVKDID